MSYRIYIKLEKLNKSIYTVSYKWKNYKNICLHSNILDMMSTKFQKKMIRKIKIRLEITMLWKIKNNRKKLEK